MIHRPYFGGVLCHHGVKGMKWGIRRTPEQLGHAVKQRVEKAKEDDTIVDGTYQSRKGFSVDQRKFTSWCLKAGTDHADEFFSVGYTESDSDRLFRDIENGFDLDKKVRLCIDWQNRGTIQHSHEIGGHGAKAV